jgi:hypothetical protein
MPKPNNPYGRPVNATKESAKTIGEYYGTRATDKTHINASGGRNVAPASRYQAVGNAYESPTGEKSKPKAKPKSKPEPETAVTAEDLFG